ncbi:MAG: Maf family protein [Lachnospiraceae bacterium]
MTQNYPIILASASPRRAQLLTQAGISFSVIPSDTREVTTALAPSQMVEELAYLKANDVYAKAKNEYTDKDFVVIGADTIVYYDGEVLGKPKDEAEAFDVLKLLSDRTHQVYTGIAIIIRKNMEKQTILLHDKTDVTFYDMTDDEIKAYIATKDPLDKAGSYGIQGPFGIHVKEIHGDYHNVVGLPIAKLYRALKEQLIIR